MKPDAAEARILLSVIEHAQNLVAIADYDTGRLLHLNPAGMHLMGLTDEAAVAARWAPEFFTDVGFVQAPRDGSGPARPGPVGGAVGVSELPDR